MSDISQVINDIIESKLLELHTSFLAKVVAVDGKKYSIKPLAKYKEYGKSAEEYPVITNVYRCKGFATGNTANYSHSHTIPSSQTSSEVYISTSNEKHAHTVPESSTGASGDELSVSVTIPIKVGDIVLCVALERDITNLSGGKSHLPLTGVHHRINDAIIIDVVDI